jgi:hypothetical protein
VADKDNVEFRYSSVGEIHTQSTFIQNAIDRKVDGIAVSMPTVTLALVIQGGRRRNLGRRVQCRRPGVVPAGLPVDRVGVAVQAEQERHGRSEVGSDQPGRLRPEQVGDVPTE